MVLKLIINVTQGGAEHDNLCRKPEIKSQKVQRTLTEFALG